MIRTITPNGLDSLKQWEGLKLEAYRDVSDIWTIGYGHTAKAGNPKPNRGMIITKQQAEAILRRDITKFEKIVSSLVMVPLTDNQFTTLVSFSFNVGIDNFTNSTLLKKLNNKEYGEIPYELTKWVYMTKNGKKFFSPGLAARRAAEAGMWVKNNSYLV